jgi:hypothetical protein
LGARWLEIIPAAERHRKIELQETGLRRLFIGTVRKPVPFVAGADQMFCVVFRRAWYIDC